MGLTGYFRKFIRDYASKSRPLSRLLLKNAPWEWTDAHETAFQTLRQCLTDRPVLTLFDPGKAIILYTDASRWGLAGILVQVDGNVERVVAYFSRHTSTDEQKFHSFELETLGLFPQLSDFVNIY